MSKTSSKTTSRTTSKTSSSSRRARPMSPPGGLSRTRARYPNGGKVK